MYRTGDLARIRPDGNIEFLGRRDYQINLRGYRIEAGEVENALMLHPAVSQAVVVAQPDQSGQLQLVAYVVGSEESPAAELRSFVAQHLPAYMVPAHIVKLPSLPTTPSGKLDRKALPTVRGLSARSSVSSRAAATKVERTLLAIWKDVLGFDEIGLDEDFWELGGDSLRAMRLIVRYREAGFAAFGLRDVFRYQTIAETAAFLADATRDVDAELVTIIRPAQHPRLRLLLLPYACGNASSFMELSRFLPADLEMLALSPHESWDGDGSDMREMARQVIAGLPDENRDSPLVVVGYSFGGVLACELVSQLERAGAAPHGVVIIAAAPPGASTEVDLILQASDEAIVAYSRDVYGFDPGTLSAGELTRYLRQLRTQTGAIARYQFDLKKRLRTPALVLVGLDEEDVELRRERQRWHGLFEDCTQDVLPGRHMLIKTHPDVLARRLMTFLETVATQRSVEAAAE
jgi:surfactin synthase thioesterase subunit/aryl carrier-like protein